jgi:hypothetical protein
MPDDKIAPTIVGLDHRSAHDRGGPVGATDRACPGAHAGVSTVEQVQSAVVGAKVKEATKHLEALGFEVRVVSLDGEPHEEAHASHGECANLTVVGGKVTHVALG